MEKVNFQGIATEAQILSAFTQIESEINDLINKSNNFETASIDIGNTSDANNSPMTLRKILDLLEPFTHDCVSCQIPLNIKLYTTTPSILSENIINFIPRFQYAVIDSNGNIAEIKWHGGVFIQGYGKFLNVSIVEDNATFTFSDTESLADGIKSFKVNINTDFTTGLKTLQIVNAGKTLLGKQKFRRSTNLVASRELGKVYGTGFRVLNSNENGINNRVAIGSDILQDAVTDSTDNNMIVYPSLIPLGKYNGTDSIIFTEGVYGINSPINQYFWELLEDNT